MVRVLVHTVDKAKDHSSTSLTFESLVEQIAHVIDLLSILLRFNDLGKILKADEQQTINDDHSLFMLCFVKVSLWKVVLEFLLCPTTKHITAGCSVQSPFHHIAQSNQKTVPLFINKDKMTMQNFPICLKYRVTVEWSKLS